MSAIICPCLSQKSYQDCCLTFHQGISIPESPEKLMRSRYSAFVLNQAKYLVDTLHPSKKSVNDLTLIQKTIDTTKWLGLMVLSSELNQSNTGEVEFVAFFDEQGTQQLHEKSRFVKEDGKWFYMDGDHLPPIKIGRNDLCFCGSGKKYKKCHGKNSNL